MNCWFCSVRASEEGHVYEVDMHGEVDAQNVQSQTNIAYSVRHIKIPRCADCHSRHHLAGFAKFMAAVCAALVLAGVVFALFGWAAPFVTGAWTGLALGLVVAFLMAIVIAQKGIHSLRNSRSLYPEVKELLDRCYRFGLRPKAILPKSDPPCDQGQNENEQM